MKIFVAFAALVALAVANPVHKPHANVQNEIEQIVAAIQSPHTDPATAVLLEQQLQNIIAAENPISVGPGIIELPSIPIAVPPAVVPAPIVLPPAKPPLRPVPVKPTPVMPSPVAPEPNTPLVQLIVNVKQPAAPAPVPAPVPVPIVIEEPTDPVIIVDKPEEPTDPVIIVEKPEEPTDPVIVVDKPLEPVVVAEPIFPVPVINLPIELS